MRAEHMARTKDDDAIKLVVRSRDNVVLELHEIRIIEMDAKGADDTDKTCLAPASDCDDVVKLTAVTARSVVS